MAEVWFYNLGQTEAASVLPDLLDKITARGHRVHVTTRDPSGLSQKLWTHSGSSFLAHGLANAEYNDQQPIIISDGLINENKADIFISLMPESLPEFDAYTRTLIVFNDQDETHLNWARQLWKRLKNTDFKTAYWQLTPMGQWVLKEG